MATNFKDFKVKNGLIVEGTSGTINNYDILTKSTDDQNYIIGLIGGSATSDATPDTVVLRDGFGSFAANTVTANQLTVQNAGNIYEDSTFIVQSNVGYGLDIQANQALNLVSTNSDIIINADGWTYLGNNSSSDNRVATLGDLTNLGAVASVSGTTNEIDATETAGAVTLSLPSTVYKTDLRIGSQLGFDIYFSDNTGQTYINQTTGDGVIHAIGDFTVDFGTTDSPEYSAFSVDPSGARTRVRNALNVRNDSGYNTFDINGNSVQLQITHPDTDNQVLTINSDGTSATILANTSHLNLNANNNVYLNSNNGDIYLQPDGTTYINSNAVFNHDVNVARRIEVGGANLGYSGYINLIDGSDNLKINIDADTNQVYLANYGQVKFSNGNDDLGWLWLNPENNDRMTLEGDNGIQIQSYFNNDIDVVASGTLHLTSQGSDIVLSADGAAYYGSISAEHEIATHGYVDNAVAGLTWKQAVNLLWNDPNAGLTGSTGTLGIDGHAYLTTSNNGYRILITAGDNRGIWDYSDDSSTWTLTRSTDADNIGELIGAAVYVMEGTQFGSTSWVQGNHYAATFTDQSWTQFSGQGSVTAGDGIAVDGLEVSIDRTTVDGWYEASGAVSTHAEDTSTHGVGEIVGTSESQTLTNKTISGDSNTISNIPNNALDHDSIDINGYTTALGGSVSLSTDDVAEGDNKYYTDAQVRDVLTTSTQTGISITESGNNLVITVDDALANGTTDNLSEGTTNKYFTDERAQDAVADAIAAGTHSNITITYDDASNKFTFAAENGVDDATTADLDEDPSGTGTSGTWYFTNARAVSALEAVVPNFTAVEIDSIAKQVAATTGLVATASTVTAYSFAKADYRSAKFLVKTAYGSHTEVAEVLLTLDTSDNIAITEYAIVGTNGSAMTISADVSGTDVRLRVATVNNNSTVNIVGTLIA